MEREGQGKMHMVGKVLAGTLDWSVNVGGGSYQYLSDVVSGFQTAFQSCPVPVDCDNRGLPVSYQ